MAPTVHTRHHSCIRDSEPINQVVYTQTHTAGNNYSKRTREKSNDNDPIVTHYKLSDMEPQEEMGQRVNFNHMKKAISLSLF